MSAPIDLGLVSAFVAVGELASFSAAGRRLGVTTATISRNIARLERSVGTQLVHRTSRHVSLSAAGQVLFERSASHLRAVSAALVNLPERQQEPAGTLRLIAPYVVGVTLLGDAVARYVARYPAVRVVVELTTGGSEIVIDGFDVALRGTVGKLRDSSLTARRLLKSEYRCYASPSYVARRGSPRLLGASDHDWILFNSIRKRLNLPPDFQPRVSANDLLTLRETTRGGVGVAPLPMFLADPLLASGDLVAVLPSFRLHAGSLVMLYSRAGQVAPKVTAFYEVLRAMLIRQS